MATIKKIKSELGEWETKLQELRVKADLGKMELRDLVTKAEERLRLVRDAIANATDESAAKAESTADGVKAAWSSFKEAYKAALERHRDS